MGGRVAVAAADGVAGQDNTLFRHDRVDDPLPGIGGPEKDFDAEIGLVFFQGGQLGFGDFILKRAGAVLGG